MSPLNPPINPHRLRYEQAEREFQAARRSGCGWNHPRVIAAQNAMQDAVEAEYLEELSR